MNVFKIYTDGSCTPQKGGKSQNRCGGWAYYLYSDKYKQESGYSFDTTINRMELQAVIKALEFITSRLEDGKSDNFYKFYTDSKYVLRCLESIEGLYPQTYTRNKDLITRMKTLLSKIPNKYKFYHVTSHATNQYNDEVDRLARQELGNAIRELKRIERSVPSINEIYGQ